MKRMILCFFCLSLPLMAEKAPITPLFISHETCNINIYETMLNLKDSLNNEVNYDVKTVKDIEVLLNKKGYHVIASLPANTLMLNVKSVFSNKETESLAEGDDLDFRMLRYDCWDVTASIAEKGQKPVYERPYSICRESTYIIVSNSKYEYGADLLKYALYNSVSYFPAEYNAGRYSMSDSIDAVLLGPRPYVFKEYKLIPHDLGILNIVPYCCTPDDKSPWCVTFRGKQKK